MEHEKKFTAKEAAQAVLKKTEELLRKNELLKKSLEEKSVKGSEDNKVEDQPAPNKNPAEQAENNNPAPGAFPQNEDSYGSEIKGHLKLAKFIGRMEHKKGKTAV